MSGKVGSEKPIVDPHCGKIAPQYFTMLEKAESLHHKKVVFLPFPVLLSLH